MPSLRLVAGPNGSGKTTLTKELRETYAVPLGQYLNPDDIAKHIDLPALLGETVDKALLQDELAARLAQKISLGLRDDWIRDRLSFTYESVMSHESHLDFVKSARNRGYKPYLYYVCTSDPELNEERITQRVALGGHSVPKEKVFGRYQRSLRYLSGMIQLCYRAYFFDNSTTKLTFLGEATPDGFLDIVEESFDNVQPMWLYNSVMKLWDGDKIRMIQPR
ncbi:zeta toxin family protein [Pectobacterium carotovorum]|uniref:zeta toxin family protein n=1 Tax=Pectobacterium carotovorum TaxID=554 RepID=UPI002A808B6F|nr:zeta toxin family protein [Pectobacterium carotovorum]MDY4373969.1 zeta toxin family protein [Pectobacterium carotovorum subsp. carotovorum]